jgi:D-beta-D-heptose 7-phosphate kinase/D-beta-D-heptose 1-phosphate adenosyltransferase
LGGSGNVVNNLLSLGARVHPVSAIGDDAAGRELTQMLARLGVDCEGIVIDGQKQTSRKTRVVVAHQQVVRLDQETTAGIDTATEDTLLHAILHSQKRFDAVLISDYNKGVVTPTLCQAIIQFARQNSIPVLVDPKGTDGSKYRGATVLTPNRNEAYGLTGIQVRDDSSVREAGQRLREELDLQYAVITLSEQGMAVCGEEMTRIRSTARDVYDVSGAGDTVLAVLSYALACGIPVTEAAELANAAAGVVVGKSGAATVTWEEIEEQRRGRSQCSRAVVQSVEQIAGIASRLRQSGKRIVFTNGCFDLLHRGHLEVLRQSRRLGDVLIVGVNSDASIRRIKGPQRPIVNQQDRVALLAALEFVDYVVVFDEDSVYDLISRVRPHVLAKGADYTHGEVVGWDVADEVRLIPLVADRSTSQTIGRIQDAA